MRAVDLLKKKKKNNENSPNLLEEALELKSGGLNCRLFVKGEVSRKFAVISKPKNVFLSAETTK